MVTFFSRKRDRSLNQVVKIAGRVQETIQVVLPIEKETFSTKQESRKNLNKSLKQRQK